MKAPIPYKLAVRTVRFFKRDNFTLTMSIALITGIIVCAFCLNDSIINSMKYQVENRLGRIESCLAAPTLFRTQLANDISIGQKNVNEKNYSLSSAAILAPALRFDMALVSHIEGSDGIKTIPVGDRRAGVLWGVESRFAHLETPKKAEFEIPKPGEATLSAYAAKIWNVKVGDGLILTIERPQSAPPDSPFAKRTGNIAQLSVTVKCIAPENTIASLNLKVTQQPAINVFVSMEWLQKKLGIEGRANIILSDSIITYNYRPVLDDYGFELDSSDMDFWTVSSRKLAFSEQERAALMDQIDILYPNKKYGLGNSISGLVKKATAIRKESREDCRDSIPYSFLAATDDVHVPFVKRGNIALTQWAANALDINVGEKIELEFYAPDSTLGEPVLIKRTWTVSKILDNNSIFYDRSWVPRIQGISDKNSIHNWDVSFPIDDRIIDPEDEEYWDLHGSTPKFYINLDEARELFTTSAGAISTVRVWGLAAPRSSELAPFPQKVGWTFIPLRNKTSLSSVGAYDFAIFFIEISIAIIVFSLLLTVLFMRLNIDYRCKIIGLLQTIGWNVKHIRQSFIYENIILSFVGAALGVGVGIALTACAIFYLNYFGLDIIGVPFLNVNINVWSLLPAAAIGWLITVIASIASIRKIDKVRSVSRLQGRFEYPKLYQPSPNRFVYFLFQTIFWLVIIAVATAPMAWNLESMKSLPRIIFYAALAALAFGIWSYYYWLKRIPITGLSSDFCNYLRNPRRSFFIMALSAIMIFLITSLSLFMYRTDRSDAITVRDNGGYRLIMKTALPIMGNIDLPSDREKIGFNAQQQETLKDVVIDRALLRDGDDASLTNLYNPYTPRIVGVSLRMMNNPLFAWKEAMIQSFPWDALWRKEYAFPMAQKEEIKQELQTDDPDVIAIKTKQAMLTRVLPFIIDFQTMKNRYNLTGLDSRLLLDDRPGREVQGRVVAIMDNDMFHGSLITSDENVRRFFPEIRGYRMFYIDCPQEKTAQVRQVLQDALDSYGAEIETVFESQDSQMQVHNAWIRVTQVWLLVGLGINCCCYYPIIRRNLLLRHGELSMLYAMGNTESQVRRVAILEVIRPLSHGINIGTMAALAAIIGATLTFKNSSLLAWTGSVWLASSIGALLLSWIVCSYASRGLTNQSMSAALKRGEK